MNKTNNYTLLSLCLLLITCITFGCSSPEDRAKEEIAKKVIEHSDDKISNISIETYYGSFPIVFDKEIIELANDYIKNVKTINSCKQLIAETNLPNPFTQNLIMRNYRRSLSDAEFNKKSNFEKIIKTYKKLDESKSDKESIIALLEYDTDDSMTKSHKREVVSVDKEDQTKLLKAKSMTPYTNNGILAAIQIIKSDTVIIEPTKDEIKQILGLMNEPALQFALRDSIN